MTFLERVNKWIDAATRAANVFLARATQSWKTVIAIVVVLLALSVASLMYAFRPRETAPVVEEPPVVATSTENLLQRALDGVLVNASSTHLLPLGVMVENSADAWPLQGPAKADLVFESPVEGGITRFFLVFDASSTVSEIGPVRSARPYFVDWADGLDAMYAHVGGSPDALAKIVSLPTFRDFNEFWNGWAFWRSNQRAAPHNIYTRPELLLKGAEQKTFAAGTFTPWFYQDLATSTTSTVDRVIAAPKINVPYDGYYAATWRYDAETDEYVRERNGAPIRDADGTQIRVKNVVILLTDGEVLDSIGRLKIRTTGRGKALVFSHGDKREASWTRTAGEHLRFSAVDGAEIPFARGKTWISVVTSADAFAKVVPE
jgi:hypothetical protein